MEAEAKISSNGAEAAPVPIAPDTTTIDLKCKNAEKAAADEAVTTSCKVDETPLQMEADVTSTNGIDKNKETTAENGVKPADPSPPAQNGVDPKPEEQQEAETPVQNGASTDNKAILSEADKLFLQGKRDFVIKDYGAAVTALTSACESYTQVYGELADELGDVYFSYGKALFYNARGEADVLGDKIDKDKEEPDSDEEDAEEEADADVDETKATDPESIPDSTTEVATKEPGTSVDVPPNAEVDEGEEKADAEEEDDDDMKLAWEILEMAKVVYLRKDDAETALKLADVHLTLGEIGIESEKFDTAVDEFKMCLEIREKNLNEDDRLIAEALFQLGTAYVYSENHDDGVKYFNLSVSQLEKRLQTLREAKESNKKCPEGESKDPFYTIDKEIDEINSIIKDIKDKVNDTEESKKVLKEKLKEQLGLNGGGGASGSSSSDKPVQDISHLVKKRKMEESNDSGTEKKAKTD